MPEGMLNALRGIYKEPEYEPHCHLSPEFLKEFNEIQSEILLLDNKIRELNARRQLFWTKIESALGIYDRNLRIDTDAGMILIEKKVVKEESDSKKGE